MKREFILQILKQRQAELTQRFGVKSLFLFGSVARDEASTSSDVDLLVEFNRPVGYFGFTSLVSICWILNRHMRGRLFEWLVRAVSS
ncbi:MAG: nucleotidyltransferase family protein [Anaerolineales bacterium]